MKGAAMDDNFRHIAAQAAKAAQAMREQEAALQALADDIQAHAHIPDRPVTTR